MEPLIPSSRPPSDCPTDEPIGIAIMALGALIALGVLVVNSMAQPQLLGILGPLAESSRAVRANAMSVQPTLTPSGAISLQNEPFSEVLGFLFVLALLYGGLMFAVGFGIRQGRINAFRWGIVCSALLLIAGAGWSILAICVIVYCCLRLLNRITGAAH